MKNIMKIAGLLVLVAAFLLQPAGAAADPSPGDARAILKKATIRLTEWLNTLDEDMGTSAQLLTGVDPASDNARDVMRGLCIARPYVIDCSIIDRSGIMVNIVPAEYDKYKGSDISKQEHIIKILKTRKPVLSGEFLSVEGVFTIVFEQPIFNNDRDFTGSLNLLIKSETFLGNIVEPLVREFPARIWIMEDDGDVIYTEHPEFMGRNIFRDEIFKSMTSLIAFAKKAAAEKSGEGSYEFYTHYDEDKKGMATYKAVWSTVGLYDTAWRVIAAE